MQICVLVVTHSAAFLLSVACYLNSLNGELGHDDIFAVRDTQDLRSSTPIVQLLHDDFWGELMRSPVSHKSYRPLTALTFRINHALHELHAALGISRDQRPAARIGYRATLLCRKIVCRYRSAGVSGWSSGRGLSSLP